MGSCSPGAELSLCGLEEALVLQAKLNINKPVQYLWLSNMSNMSNMRSWRHASRGTKAGGRQADQSKERCVVCAL